MLLNNLRDKLYSKQSDISSRKPQTDTFDPRTKVGGENSPTTDIGEKKDLVIETGTTKRQKTFMLLALSVIGGLLLFGGGGYLLYKVLHKDFYQQQVKLNIEVPPAVNLNDEVSINISYANNNPVDLKSGHLTIETPLNFRITSTDPQADSVGKFSAEWNLGSITAQKTGNITIKGKFVSREEGSISLKGTLSYTPSNFNSTFQNEATASTEVSGIPIGLSLNATRSVASGYAVVYKLYIKNNGSNPFQNIKVKLTYPDGFSFVNSTLPLTGTKNDIWSIPTILSGEEKALEIDGNLNGVAGDQKVILAQLGKDDQGDFQEYDRKEGITSVTEPPIVIKQESKDGKTVVHKGDDLFFTVNYTNKSERPIGQVVIKAKLDGVIFDYKGINPDNGGWFDPNNKEIVWQGGKTPGLDNLNPGDSGELTYRIKIANFIPFSQTQKSNFTGRITITADSPQMPADIGGNKVIIGNSLELKLSSEVSLKSVAYYSDGTIPNSGPIPPEVGKRTTYTIHWTLTNAFNDLSGVEVSSVLPCDINGTIGDTPNACVEVKTDLPFGVEWMDKIFPQRKGVTFQERNRQVLWNLERVPAGSGGENPAVNLVFQVGVTPSATDVGKPMEIIGPTTLKATDSFTNETLTATANSLDTSVPTDSSIGEGMGVVVNPGDSVFNNPDAGSSGE